MTKEEVIKIMKLLRSVPTSGEDSDVNQALDIVIKMLEQKPKIGYWIKTGDYYTGAYGSIEYVECSCCHEDSLEEGNYCPNCGAKMEGRVKG